MGFRKLVMMILYARQERDTDIKNSLLDSVGEGEGGMTSENSLETCILSYMKQITSEGLMCATGCSGLVHLYDPVGWVGVGEGGWFRMGNTCTSMADLYQCIAKTTTIF